MVLGGFGWFWVVACFITNVYILDQGDQQIKSLNVNHPLAVAELPLFVKIKSFDIKLKVLQHHNDLFNNIDLFLHHKRLTPDKTGNGAIFTCPGFSFAFIWIKNPFLCLTPIVVIVKIFIFQMVSHSS